MLFSTCCSYEKEEFFLNAEEASYFDPFTEGDTLYYESSSGDVDTFLIEEVSKEPVDPDLSCKGFMAIPPANTRQVSIRHLPVDRWVSTSVSVDAEGNRTSRIHRQTLISVLKSPALEGVDYAFSFRDFYADTRSFPEESNPEPLIINGKRWESYYELLHAYPERVEAPEDIERIYWSRETGMIAYQNKAGELWTLK